MKHENRRSLQAMNTPAADVCLFQFLPLPATPSPIIALGSDFASFGPTQSNNYM
jgi:hypothetical protein